MKLNQVKQSGKTAFLVLHMMLQLTQPTVAFVFLVTALPLCFFNILSITLLLPSLEFSDLTDVPSSALSFHTATYASHLHTYLYVALLYLNLCPRAINVPLATGVILLYHLQDRLFPATEYSHQQYQSPIRSLSSTVLLFQLFLFQLFLLCNLKKL